MPRGIIKRVFTDRGFGFIKPDAGGSDVWFHASVVQDGVRFSQLDVGLAVEYEARQGTKGPQATAVHVQMADRAGADGLPATATYRFLNPYIM
jgi:CspA family cold shock protein